LTLNQIIWDSIIMPASKLLTTLIGFAILISPIIQVNAIAAAKTGTTGWVTGYEAIRLGKSRDRYGIVPTKIQCKNGKNNRGDFRKNLLVKVDYRFQDKKKPIYWAAAWHTAMKQFEIKYKRKGFKMVSRDSYVRGSGLRVHCALWHKKPKKK
jgi:hypothetical protein